MVDGCYKQRTEQDEKEGQGMKNKTPERDPVAIRLDAIIRLLMDGQRAQELGVKITKNDQVLLLHSVGLTDTEIGNIIGQPRNEVASLRTKLRKANKK
jgi:hypothetical protein